jgi:hypothetical protein
MNNGEEIGEKTERTEYPTGPGACDISRELTKDGGVNSGQEDERRFGLTMVV